MTEKTTLHVQDRMGGHLTLHPHGPGGLLGMVISDRDDETAAIMLSDDDRRALAAALLEGL